MYRLVSPLHEKKRFSVFGNVRVVEALQHADLAKAPDPVALLEVSEVDAFHQKELRRRLLLDDERVAEAPAADFPDRYVFFHDYNVSIN